MNLGPYLGDDYTACLRHALSLKPKGWALEFGVAEGGTLSTIAAHMPAVGFDSFNGLPEDWRTGFGAGKFACPIPDVDAELVVGLFEDTLPNWTPPGPIGLVHIDCDLYTSTVTILTHLEQHLEPGCLIVFDEYHGYGPDAQHHEAKAWAEYVERTGTQWETLGHGPEQLVIRLLGSSSPGETVATNNAEPTTDTPSHTT